MRDISDMINAEPRYEQILIRDMHTGEEFYVDEYMADAYKGSRFQWLSPRSK